MSKTQMQYANRAWRKATANWGMTRKAHRDFCRAQAAITVAVDIAEQLDMLHNQADADYAVREELTYWGD